MADPGHVESDDHHTEAITVTKTGQLINKTKRYIKTNSNMVEEYLRNETSKINLPQTAHKFKELADHFIKLNEHKYPKKVIISESSMSKVNPIKEPIFIQS